MVDYVNLPTGKADSATPVSYFMTPARDDLAFIVNLNKLCAPGIVNPDNILDKNRDWEHAYRHPKEGFMGVRWNPAWIRTDAQVARWQPAGADIYRIQRKGNAGEDLKTLVFITSPNSHKIPSGDPVVIWQATGDDSVSSATSQALSGFNLPLKSKLNISNCVPSAQYDINGRRNIEINMGVDLPIIDYIPPFFNGENGFPKSTMQLRHWSFYANAATKELRLPFAYFFELTKKAIKSGAVAILGGNRWAPSTYDWSKDYLNFGASLTEELFRLECRGLADNFANENPQLLAVELENNPTQAWLNNGTIPGYKSLLSDVWYPIARQEWGQERTLIVKGTGGVNAVLNNFDWSPPRGERAHLALHASDSGIIGPDGAIDFGNIGQADWLASALRSKIDALGFSGGGITSLHITPPQNTVEKSKRLGRVLTSFYSKQMYVFYYSHINSNPDTTTNVADVFNIDGHRIEALYPEMRANASRAGLIFN